MRPRLVDRIGHRGAILIALASLDIVIGGMLLRPSAETRAQSLYRWIDTVAPLPAWGVLWLAVAAICLAYAPRAADAPAYTAAVALKVAWGFLASAGWMLGEVPRGYVSAATWLFAAGVVAICSDWTEAPPRGRGTKWTRR